MIAEGLSQLRAASRAQRRLYIAIIYAIILAPKIPFISVPGETAGIRLDDLVIWGFALPLLLADRELMRDRVFGAALFFIASCLPSLLLGGTFLYPLRFLQYALLISVGAAAGLNLRRLLYVFLWLNGTICVLQSTGIIGYFREGIYLVGGFGARAFGTTGGPYEVAACANLATALILAAGWKQPLLARRREALGLFILAGVICLCAASRSGVVVHLILFTIYLACVDRVRLVLLGITVAGFAWCMTLSGVTVARIDAGAIRTAAGVSSVGPDRPEGDPSLAQRLDKWNQALDQAKNGGWVATVYGVGMGRFGPALDGGWLRIWCETGVMGLTGFLVLMLASLQRFQRTGSSLLVAALPVFALAGNQVFIDAYLSSKTMMLFFISLGSLRVLNLAASSAINVDSDHTPRATVGQGWS